MRLARRARIHVERDAQTLERLLDDVVVAVNDILWLNAFLLGLDGDGYTVLVAPANHDHILAFEAQVADILIGRDVDTRQVADVNGAVGVGQRCGHERALKFLLFHDGNINLFL